MHELGITQGILDIAVEKAGEAGSHRVTDIYLVIGDASSIIDDCVQFCFDFVSKDTIAEGAKLHFNRIPLEVRCRNCDNEFSPQKQAWECPRCKKWEVDIIRGKEFYMESIEVD